MATILVVDDETALLHLVGEFLSEDLGHQVIVHESGESAMKAFKDQSVSNADLLITDYRMQGMTGAELIQKIHAGGRPIKNILLTGYLEKNVQQSLEPYSTICLKKPVSLKDLEDLINEML